MIQQRSDGQDLEMENGSEGGEAASRPLGLAAEWIQEEAPMQRTQEGRECKGWWKDGLGGEVSVGTSGHSDVLRKHLK